MPVFDISLVNNWLDDFLHVTLREILKCLFRIYITQINLVKNYLDDFLPVTLKEILKCLFRIYITQAGAYFEIFF